MNKEMEPTKIIWLGEYAHEYRFIIRYPQPLTHLTRYQYEPWHITYVCLLYTSDAADDTAVV